VTDSELLLKLKDGDEEAKELLYRNYRQRLYATACHFLGYQDSEAEDLVHDSFAAFYESIGRFEGRSSLYTWLNHICVNLCYSRIRKRRRLVALSDEAWEAAQGKASLEAAHRKDEEAQRLERLARLGSWLAKLGGLCQKILRMRLLEHLSLFEIKEKLAVPMGTAAARVSRCQKALKELAESDLREKAS
jgi:RNA polymerase sigma-70 factor (ECF subfamily)